MGRHSGSTEKRPRAGSGDESNPSPKKKSRKTDNHAPAPPQPQPELTGDKLKALQAKQAEDLKKAKAANLPGVYVVEADFANNITELSAYLGYTSTRPIHELIRNPAARKIFLLYIENRQHKFGLPGGTSTSQWTVPAMLDFLSLPKAESWITARPDIPRDHDIEVGSRKGWTYQCQYIYALFDVAPEIAVDRAQSNSQAMADPICGLTPEDWHRGLSILRYAFRQKHIIKGNKALGSNFKDMVAVQPQWLTPKDKGEDPEALRAAKADEPQHAEKFLTKVAALEAQAEDPQHQQPGRLSAKEQNLDELRNATELSDALSAMHEGYRYCTESTFRDKTNVRKPLTQMERLVLVKQWRSHTRIVYPDNWDKIVPTTDEIAKLGAEQRQVAGNPTLNTIVDANIAAEGVEQGPASNPPMSPRPQDNIYHRRQRAMNRQSALPPGYKAACRVLGLDPKKPILPFGTKYEMHAWQVQYVAWKLKVQKILSGTVLADDMGLGKTLSALSVVSAVAHQEWVAYQKEHPEVEIPTFDNVADEVRSDIAIGAQGPLADTGSSNQGQEKTTTAAADDDVAMEDAPVSTDPNAPTEASTAHGTTVEDDTPDVPESVSSDDEGDGTTTAGEAHRSPRSRNRHPLTSHKERRDDKRLTPAEQREKKHGQCERIRTLIGDRRYKPTLVVCESSGGIVWTRELEQQRGLANHMRLFHGSPSQHPSNDLRKITLDVNITSLLHDIRQLPDTPAALQRVYVTTYNTWVHRSMDWASEVPEHKALRRPKAGDEDDDLDDATADVERTPEDMQLMKTFCRGLFGRVICDEAHRLRSDKTFTHSSIYQLDAAQYDLVTATPMFNKGVDLRGLLYFVWKFDVNPDAGLPNLQAYTAAKAHLVGKELSPEDLKNFGHLLHHESYYNIAKAQAGQHLDAETAADLIPPLLSLMYLRRTSASTVADVNGRTLAVGESIPHGEWKSIELVRGQLETDWYAPTHARCAPNLGIGVNAETREGQRHMGEHRRLSHAVLHPGLDDVLKRRRKNAVADVNQWHGLGDHGATMFFANTRTSARHPTPQSRFDLCNYMAACSVKLRATAILAYDICVVQKRKLLIFAEWPVTQWLLECFLINLGIPILAIRSMHHQRERDAAVRKFNDPTDDAMCMVTSPKTSGTGVNMQTGCSDTLFVDGYTNAQAALQASGRTLRLGQKHKCTFYTLTTHHSYDQALTAMATTKMLPVIAGQADITVPQDVLDKIRRRHEGDEERANEVTSAFARDFVEQKADDYYVALFGQRTSRKGWKSVRNLALKDEDPKEAAFMKDHDICAPPDGLVQEDKGKNGHLKFSLTLDELVAGYIDGIYPQDEPAVTPTKSAPDAGSERESDGAHPTPKATPNHKAVYLKKQAAEQQRAARDAENAKKAEAKREARRAKDESKKERAAKKQKAKEARDLARKSKPPRKKVSPRAKSTTGASRKGPRSNALITPGDDEEVENQILAASGHLSESSDHPTTDPDDDSESELSDVARSSRAASSPTAQPSRPESPAASGRKEPSPFESMTFAIRSPMRFPFCRTPYSGSRASSPIRHAQEMDFESDGGHQLTSQTSGAPGSDPLSRETSTTDTHAQPSVIFGNTEDNPFSSARVLRKRRAHQSSNGP